MRVPRGMDLFFEDRLHAIHDYHHAHQYLDRYWIFWRSQNGKFKNITDIDEKFEFRCLFKQLIDSI